MPVKGFDEFAKRLEKLRKNVNEKIGGEHKVPLDELFTDDFMARHTKFQTWQQMIEASGVQSPEEITTESFSEFVARNSTFASWTEMLIMGRNEWYKRQLES
jgi:hypothetical protein